MGNVMNKLKCIGSKCPKCYKHDFYGFYFVCGLNQSTFKQDEYKEKNCPIDDVIAQKYGEISRLKDLVRVVERGDFDE